MIFLNFSQKSGKNAVSRAVRNAWANLPAKIFLKTLASRGLGAPAHRYSDREGPVAP